LYKKSLRGKQQSPDVEKKLEHLKRVLEKMRDQVLTQNFLKDLKDLFTFNETYI
jgi:5,10-methylenetetrahydrofolate reductase